MPHAYRPTVHYPRSGPRDPALASDFAFIGTAFKSRVDFFEQLDLDGIDTLIAGNDWGKVGEDSPVAPHIATGAGNEADCIDNPRTAELYRHSRIGLNLYRREAEKTWNGEATAISPREVEMAACGLPFLRDPRAEGDEVLGMLPLFHDPGEASGQLHYWLAHDASREAIAARAREAIAGRTFEANARRLLGLIEALPARAY